MKHALRTLSLLALMAHAVPLAALAPADVARLEQEVRAAITAGDYLIAQDLIARLEGAGARATAQPLMVQLSKALEKRAIGAAELERQYRNLEARELVPLRRLRVELENQVGRLKKDLEVSRKFGQEQQEKVGAAGRRIRTLEKQLEVEKNQREQAETAYNDLRAKFTSKTDRVADLEQQVKDLTSNVTTLQNKAQRFQKENELLIQKATDLALEKDQLKASQQTKIDDATKALNQRIAELEAQKQDEVRAANDLLIQKRQDLETAQQQLRAAEEEQDRLEKLTDNLNKLVGDITAQLRTSLSDAAGQATPLGKYKELDTRVREIIDRI